MKKPKKQKPKKDRVICPLCGAPRSEWNPAVSIHSYLSGITCAHCGAPSKP